MNIMDLITGEPLINFKSMLLFVIIGLMTISFDGGLMKKLGLERERFWSKIFGGILILGGIGGWIVFMIWG